MSLQVELLQQSFELVKPRADEFVDSFYDNLFALYPEAKPLFANTDMAEQKKKLLISLMLVVKSLRMPDLLSEVLKGLGERHVKYGALPEHYPLVGNALLSTFEQYLGADWTPAVKQAWVDAYGAITTLMLEGAEYVAEEIALDFVPPAVASEEAPEAEESGLKVELLETSFEKIKPRADEFANSFYSNLFTLYPEAKPLFANTDMAAQKKKLLSSLMLVVGNLRMPDVLSDALKGLGARHVKYGALPEHYPLVGNALLTTFEQYLGEDWTPEVTQAWVDAYGAITTLMLEGADYAAEEVALESAPANSEIEVSRGKVNWGLFGGIFGGAGLVMIILLLLL